METTNLSKIRRDKMLNTIDEIKKNITDEKILTNLSMIENELTKKKYGLIWEEHEERVDKELETQIPTFEEIKDKEIVSNPDEKFNFLLEGDNLHSLYLLEKTHENRIDVILIDPPYNTGGKDFIYNDTFIDTVDSFRHSKWLSFMSRRLTLAKKLLKDSGVIFINIDDNEHSQLKLLCDNIFGEENFITSFPWHNRTSMQNDTDLSINHEYILTYAKKRRYIERRLKITNKNKWYDIKEFAFQPLPADKSKFSNPDNDSRGVWKADPFDAPAIRPNLTYKIVNPNTGETYLPPKGRHWRTEQAKYEALLKDNRIVFGKNGKSKPQLKVFYDEVSEKGQVRNSWFDSEEYGTSTMAKKELLDILNDSNAEDIFSTPKPVSLYKKLLEMSIFPNVENPIILDFFAGSGTTGQAVLEYNKEFSQNAKFILCTNNESNICEEITFKRIARIINGYTNSKNKHIMGLPSNLKYYKCTYVPRINTETENLHNNLLINIKNLIQLENGIEIDDNKIRVYLNEDELDKFSTNEKELEICKKIYISSDILLTSEQENIFENNNIEVYIIPEYYFEDEIMEVM